MLVIDFGMDETYLWSFPSLPPMQDTPRTQREAQGWELGYGLDMPSKASNTPPDTMHDDGIRAMAWKHHQRLQTHHPIRRTMMGARLWPGHTINGEAKTKERREWGPCWDPKVRLT